MTLASYLPQLATSAASTTKLIGTESIALVIFLK